MDPAKLAVHEDRALLQQLGRRPTAARDPLPRHCRYMIASVLLLLPACTADPSASAVASPQDTFDAARAAWLAEDDRLEASRESGLAARIRLLVRLRAEARRWAGGGAQERLDALAARVRRGECTPAQAAAEFD